MVTKAVCSNKFCILNKNGKCTLPCHSKRTGTCSKKLLYNQHFKVLPNAKFDHIPSLVSISDRLESGFDSPKNFTRRYIQILKNDILMAEKFLNVLRNNTERLSDTIHSEFSMPRNPRLK